MRADQSEVLAGLTPATHWALRNAQLAAVARARLAEVQASQRRIVAASAAERRGIERDLHDGANNAWSASRSTRGSPSLVPIRRPPRGSPAPRPGVRDALAHLRRLAHGIFPSVLATEGLAAALDELVAASDVPATLTIRVDDVADAPAMAASSPRSTPSNAPRRQRGRRSRSSRTATRSPFGRR